MGTLPSERNLYHVLERVLKTQTHPQTCVTLFDVPEVRAIAADVNAVSDALGNLWRRGYLFREPALKTPHSQAKWAYSWKPANFRRVLHPAELAEMQARAYDAQPRHSVVAELPIAKKPAVHVEGDSVVIDLPNVHVVITSKR
jgi:hypothetical protein